MSDLSKRDQAILLMRDYLNNAKRGFYQCDPREKFET